MWRIIVSPSDQEPVGLFKIDVTGSKPRADAEEPIPFDTHRQHPQSVVVTAHTFHEQSFASLGLRRLPRRVEVSGWSQINRAT